MSYLASSALLALIKSEKPDHAPLAYPYSSYTAYSPALSSPSTSLFSRPVYASGHPFAVFAKPPATTPIAMPRHKKEQSTLACLWLLCCAVIVVGCVFAGCFFCSVKCCVPLQESPWFCLFVLHNLSVVSLAFLVCFSSPDTDFAALFSPRSPLRAGQPPKSKFGLSQDEKERTFIAWAKEEDQIILQTVNLFGHNWFLAWHMLQLSPRLSGRMRSQKDVYLRYQSLTSKKGGGLLAQHGLTAGVLLCLCSVIISVSLSRAVMYC